MDSTQLFADPATSLRAIFCHVLMVFAADWRTFVIFSALKFGAILCYITLQVQIFRLLSGVEVIDENVLVVFLRMQYGELAMLLSLWIVVSLLFLSFTSAVQADTVSAVADIYAGRSPSWEGPVGMGWKTTWRIFSFRLVLWTAYAIACIVSGAAAAPIVLTPEGATMYVKWDTLVLITILALDISIDINAAVVSIASSIVIEQTSSADAVQNAWRLCKGSMCFINGCILCLIFFECIVTVGALVYNNDLSGSDGSITTIACVICATMISLSCLPFNMIVGTVIYFSLRIEKDGLTQNGLVQELTIVLPKADLLAEYQLASQEDSSLQQKSSVEVSIMIV